MKQLILLNGPPGSGKDTIADALVQIFSNAEVEKFAKPIKEHCKAIYGLTQEQWDEVDSSQDAKAAPHPYFFGQSCRQVQINFSELFLKPTHGKDIFGKLLFRRVEASTADYFFISDSGFKEEAEKVIEEFGNENVTLVRIHRDGCDYSIDSRSYVYLPENVRQITIQNNGTVAEAVDKITTFLANKE
jgi:hypothetical protein